MATSVRLARNWIHVILSTRHAPTQHPVFPSIKRLRERFSFLWLAGSFIKWIAIAVLVGLPAGAASALFLSCSTG